MTAREASKLIKAELVAQAIPHNTVTARTVSFSDLGRGERIFVTINGWEAGYQSPARYAHIKELAIKNGFSVDIKLARPQAVQS